MGFVRGSEKGFLLVGFIYKRGLSLDPLLVNLQKHFGDILLSSPLWDFSSFTNYYKEEMGENLDRRFFVFDKLIYPIELAEIKIFTNSLESSFSINGRRQFNIDPGFLSHNKLLLATTKNHYHRIYLKRGIYVELTMSFVHNKWVGFNWTYPDYRSYYRYWFQEIRNWLKDRIIASD